jgi:predicted phage terminase large subunit-like protein
MVEDCTLGQWEALERERHIKATAEIDGRGVRIYIEQEPGSGGKESAQATIRKLSGFLAYADHPTGAKEVRAEPYAAQVLAENVYLVRGAWNLPFKQEHQSFPVGRTKDMVDASAAAFNLLNVPIPTVTSTEILF